MELSICIPTYNRLEQLDNCLNSILISKKYVNNFDFEVCISDNGSIEDVSRIVKKYENKLKIKLNKNSTNIGFALNAIKTVKMGEGKFAWIIGNDDLLLPRTLYELKNIMEKNSEVDFFFINTFYLKSSVVERFSHPFDSNNLTDIKMKKLSSYSHNKKVNFWEIIDPKVSWEFLIGIFLSAFKREKWIKNIDSLNEISLKDTRLWSNFDNTCMNAKIIARSFKNSKAYIISEPLSVNLFGKREWGTLYEFVEIVRIPELIDFYRDEGLPFFQYIYCKNFALRNFFNYFVKIIITGESAGLKYINFYKHFLKNLIFPNSWLSIVYYLYRQITKILNIRQKHEN